MKLTVLTEATRSYLETMSWLIANKLNRVWKNLWNYWNEGLNEILADPFRFPQTEDGPRDPVYRNYPTPRYGYRIIYEIAKDEIIIHAFMHARRKPGIWLKSSS